MFGKLFNSLSVKKTPAEKIDAALTPIVEKLEDIVSISGGAMVLEVVPHGEGASISLRRFDAKAFPQDSEYYHTRESDPVEVDGAFTIAADLRQGEVFITATSHDHTRMRTGGAAHGQVDERVPDFEGFAVGDYAGKVTASAAEFVGRALPEHSFNAQQLFAIRSHKPDPDARKPNPAVIRPRG